MTEAERSKIVDRYQGAAYAGSQWAQVQEDVATLDVALREAWAELNEAKAELRYLDSTELR